MERRRDESNGNLCCSFCGKSQKEVKTLTTQGRLSGIILACLVPVSAGFLFIFNPEYMKVMVDTFVGQLLLATTIALLAIGWIVISQLLRFERG